MERRGGGEGGKGGVGGGGGGGVKVLYTGKDRNITRQVTDWD